MAMDPPMGLPEALEGKWDATLKAWRWDFDEKRPALEWSHVVSQAAKMWIYSPFMIAKLAKLVEITSN